MLRPSNQHATTVVGTPTEPANSATAEIGAFPDRGSLPRYSRGVNSCRFPTAGQPRCDQALGPRFHRAAWDSDDLKPQAAASAAADETPTRRAVVLSIFAVPTVNAPALKDFSRSSYTPTPAIASTDLWASLTGPAAARRWLPRSSVSARADPRRPPGPLLRKGLSHD
jgi:hypothetical protein